MTDRFDLYWPFTLSAEGGYSTDSRDNGNWWNGIKVGSNFGITAADVATYDKHININAAFMRNMTAAYAKTIARVCYCQALSCTDTPAGIDIVVFDFGFNAGKGTSARQLQTALGFTGDDVDGWIGSETLAAVSNIADIPAFLKNLAALETTHYRALASFPTYGNGWLNRVNARLNLALRMVDDPTLSA